MKYFFREDRKSLILSWNAWKHFFLFRKRPFLFCNKIHTNTCNDSLTFAKWKSSGKNQIASNANIFRTLCKPANSQVNIQFKLTNICMEMLKTNFANSTEQHRMVLDNRTIDQFYEQDSYFSKIGEKYQHVILCLRKMIHDAEIKELLRQRQKNES